jgi:hypothetical protein
LGAEDIIFKIGSKLGPGGFSSLQSAFQLISGLAGKINETTKDLDQFSQMWQRANQSAVMMADTAAAGLVDTTEIIRGHNKLMEAGVKITDEEFRTITARSAEMAQATGQDATEAFNRLTDGIAKGSTRALKEYGVSITTSTDLTKTHKAAVKGLTEGYEGLTASAETTTERMFALENNIDTAIGLLYDAVGASAAFGEELDTINAALGEFNSWIAESPETMAGFIFGADGMTAALVELGNVISQKILAPFIWIEEQISGKGGVLAQFAKDLEDTYSSVTEGIYEDLYIKRGREAATRAAAGVGKGRGPGKTSGPTTGRGRGKTAEAPISIEAILEEAASIGEDDEGSFLNTDYLNEVVEQSEMLAVVTESASYQQTQMTLARRQDYEATLQQIEAQTELLQTEEYKQQQLTIWREEEILKREEDALYREYQLEQQIDFAQTWSDTWNSAFSDVSAGALVARHSISAMHKGVEASFRAIILGEKGLSDVFWQILRDTALAISIESGIKAMYAFGQAALATAQYRYDQAALYTVAGVQNAATAVVAGGVAAGAHSQVSSTAAAKPSQPAVGGGGGGGGGGRTYSAESAGGGGGVGNEPQEVHLYLHDGLDGMFDVIWNENENAKKGGRPSFESLG